MASANSKVGFEVFIDGQSEFFKTLEQMQQRWKSINEEIKRTKESMDRFAATGDLQGFTRANDDFTRLTANSRALKKIINETEKGISDVDTILGRMGSSSLKQMKSDLNTLKSGFKFIDPSDREKLEKYSKAMGELNYRIKDAEKATRAVIMPEKELQSVLANLKTAPIDQLKKAQEELTRKVNETTRGTKEWKETTEKLSAVKEQIKSANGEITKQKDAWERATDRLKTYVGVYLGFNMLLQQVRQKFQDIMRLSDQMSDIQKTTGLQPSKVREVAEAINSIDTRNSLEQIYNLATVAGQIGLKKQEDIIGFTKAADQMSVALNELGEDGAQSLAKIAMITGDFDRYGAEEALTRVGSAINELTANSAATAAPIVDFINRTGAIATTCKLSMSEVAGLGATLNALAQPTEMSATAINRFVMALRNNHRGIAAELGMDPENLEMLIESGKTMEAMVSVLERMNEMGSEAEVVYQQFGSEGVRIKEVLGALAPQTKFLREQIELSSQAFRENTSLSREYAIKNGNAAAMIERAWNRITKAFANPDTADGLRFIAYLVRVIAEVLSFVIENAEKFAGAVAGVRMQMRLTKKASDEMATSVDNGTKKVGLMAKASQLLQLAWKNIIGLMAGAALFWALTKLAEYIGKIRDEANSALNSAKEWAGSVRAAVKESMNDVDIMFNSIRRHISEGTTGTKEFADIIGKVNSQYGQYINFTITQTTSLQELAVAQEMVNAGIRKQILLESQRDRTKDIIDNNKEDIDDAWGEIQKKLSKGGTYYSQNGNVKYNPIAKGAMPAVENAIQSVVANAISSSKTKEFADNYSATLIRDLEKAFKKIGLQNAKARAYTIWNPVFQYLKLEAREAKEIADSNAEVQREVEQANKQVAASVKKQLTGIQNEYNKLYKSPKANAARLLELAMNYKSVFNANLGNLDEAAVSLGNKTIANFERQKTQLREMAGQISQFGFEATDIAKMSGDEIKRASDTLLKEWKRWSANGDWQKFGQRVRGAGFSSREEANAWVNETKEAFGRRSDELRINRPGGWQWDKEPKAPKEPKFDESEGAIAALDRYYEKLTTGIQTQLAEQAITIEEGQRRIDQIEVEHLNKRADLRKSFTKDNNEYEREGLMNWWAIKVEEGSLSAVSWAKIDKEWSEAKKKAAEKNKLDWQKDLNSSKEIFAKMHEQVRKALLEYDPIQKVLEDMRSNLDSINFVDDGNLVSILGVNVRNDNIENSEMQNVENRFHFIFQHMKDAVKLGADELREMMDDAGMATWEMSLGDEELNLLLLRMEDFQDKYMQAIRQQATKLKARIAQEMKESGEAQERAEIERRSKNREESAKLVGGVSYFGASEKSLQGTTWADEAALDTMRMKIQLENEYMYALAERQRQELEAAEKIEDANKREQEQLRITEEYKILAAEHTKTLMELNQQYATQLSEDAMKVTEQISPYADAMVEFADNSVPPYSAARRTASRPRRICLSPSSIPPRRY